MELKVQENHTVRNTAVAAAVGASAATISNYITQQHILKHPESVVDTFTKYIAELSAREPKTQFAKELNANRLKGAREHLAYVEELIKSGKVNNKELGKAAAVGAIVTGCAYLVYKGIKSLYRSYAINHLIPKKDS